ncbi:MAG: glycerophosphodiester phosphodiesterase [Clostridia bacterium]|nr:glycerophosphodiester phosphodiesterase [Clostridia bacterium]
MQGWLIALIVVASLLILLPLFCFAPGIPSKKKKAAFYGKNIAHRGLHEKDQSIPENSLLAFSRAVENGYGVELDVQLSRDGRVVVFHDDDLSRVCGDGRRVDEVDFDELRTLSLCGTEEKIPLFDEVLATIAGKTPIIVELKTGRRNKELCEKTLAALRAYSGKTCIESFDPFIVAWLRLHARDIFRGQLSQPPKFYREVGKSPLVSFILGTTLFNFLARPNFIAYRIGKKTFGVRLAEFFGAVPVAWTSHSDVTEKDYDVVIFEYYRPKTEYKFLK